MKTPENYEAVANTSGSAPNGQIAAILALAASVDKLARVQALTIIRSRERPASTTRASDELERIAFREDQS